MNPEQVALHVIGALDAEEIPYLLSGSFASNYYGIPRSTEDADFVVQLSGKSITCLRPHLGPEMELDPQMSFEMVTVPPAARDAVTRKHAISVGGTQFTVELFHLSDDPHDQKRFGRRRTVPFHGREIFLPTIEDVIVTKLRWALQPQREKDRNDVRDCIAVAAGTIDWPYVHTWTARHGTQELLQEIRRSIPPA